jgi:1-deoxy-D-xylulose 5-phosphate reductoisomerase
MFGGIAIDEAHIFFTGTQDQIDEILHRKSHVHQQINPCPQFMFVPLCMQE